MLLFVPPFLLVASVVNQSAKKEEDHGTCSPEIVEPMPWGIQLKTSMPRIPCIPGEDRPGPFLKSCGDQGSVGQGMRKCRPVAVEVCAPTEREGKDPYENQIPGCWDRNWMDLLPVASIPTPESVKTEPL